MTQKLRQLLVLILLILGITLQIIHAELTHPQGVVEEGIAGR